MWMDFQGLNVNSPSLCFHIMDNKLDGNVITPSQNDVVTEICTIFGHIANNFCND